MTTQLEKGSQSQLIIDDVVNIGVRPLLFALSTPLLFIWTNRSSSYCSLITLELFENGGSDSRPPSRPRSHPRSFANTPRWTPATSRSSRGSGSTTTSTALLVSLNEVSLLSHRGVRVVLKSKLISSSFLFLSLSSRCSHLPSCESKFLSFSLSYIDI